MWVLNELFYVVYRLLSLGLSIAFRQSTEVRYLSDVGPFFNTSSVGAPQ